MFGAAQVQMKHFVFTNPYAMVLARQEYEALRG